MARHLRDIGIDELSDLRGRDAEELYSRSCDVHQCRLDRCVLYVYRCAVYYASAVEHDPELLKWWNWKDDALGAPLSASGGESPGAPPMASSGAPLGGPS